MASLYYYDNEDKPALRRVTYLNWAGILPADSWAAKLAAAAEYASSVDEPSVHLRPDRMASDGLTPALALEGVITDLERAELLVGHYLYAFIVPVLAQDCQRLPEPAREALVVRLNRLSYTLWDRTIDLGLLEKAAQRELDIWPSERLYDFYVRADAELYPPRQGLHAGISLNDIAGFWGVDEPEVYETEAGVYQSYRNAALCAGIWQKHLIIAGEGDRA